MLNKKKLYSKTGVKFYPGILVGAMTSNQDGKTEHEVITNAEGEWSDEEMRFYETRHRFFIPFVELAFVRGYLEYNVDEMALQWIKDLMKHEN